MTRQIYEEFIRNHPNYLFIPTLLKTKWVCASKQHINPRTEYWNKKRDQLILSGEISNTSTLTNVARFIHPTKLHVCKVCNVEGSIYYEYPTINTWKWLSEQFNIHKTEFNKYHTIFQLLNHVDSSNPIVHQYFGKSLNELKEECYRDQYTGKKLSPGVMANPPDRLDGFHCYNSICDCRKNHDKGRSNENMKSYTRDRRCYEMFSDGNCLLANAVMGKLNTIQHKCFLCNQVGIMTADHIGPISLGFIHDPHNFQACCLSCNSSKNNRFTMDDMMKIKLKEEQGISMISWWAKKCWDTYKIIDDIKIIHLKLNNNSKKMLCIMEWIKRNKSDVLLEFILTEYLNHNQSYTIDNFEILSNGNFNYDYTVIPSIKKTKIKQKDRTIDILLENKINRKVKIILTEEEIRHLSTINTSNFKNTICKILV